MQRFKVYATDYNGKIPKITSIYNGYRGLNKGIAISWNGKFIPIVLPINERKGIAGCSNCGSTNIKKVHSLSSRLPWWWHIECFDCHWCGKTKFFLYRAIKSWNKEMRNNNAE